VTWLPLPARPHPVAAVLGDAVEDVVAHLQTPFVPGGTAEGLIVRRLGGSAANLAVNLVRQGVATRFYGRVGPDAVGDRVAGELAASGVDARVARTGVTPTVIALVDPDGVPSYATDSLANPQARVGDDLPRRDVGELSLVHLGGWWLLGGLPDATLVDVATAAHGAGCALSVDLGSVERLDAVGRARFRALLGTLRPAVVVGTRAEAEAAALLEEPLPGAALVATDGARGATARGPDGEEVVVPATPVAPGTDTVGAGDAFLAGLLAAGLRGSSLADACAAGHASARAWLTR
jgi:sugar/nucleoside kinase (ribokinase family)